MSEFISQTQGLSVVSASPASAAAGRAQSSADFGSFLENLLDIVNPLQHLPVISTLYRSLTGDEITAPARLIGGALFGGPLGAASAAVNLAVEDITGRDIGDHALALLTDEDETPGVQYASLEDASPPAARNEPTLDVEIDGDETAPYVESWNGVWYPREALTVRRHQIPAHAASGGAQHTAALPPTTPPDRPQASLAQTAAPAPPEAATAATGAMAAKTGAPASVAPTAPAWLTAALADAEAERTAILAGRGPVEKPAPQWIGTAMAHALEKYHAMALDRAGGHGNKAATARHRTEN